MNIRNDLLQQILTAINAGGGVLPADNARAGYASYSDLATVTTPIVVPPNTPTKLTNDGLGPQTQNTYLPTGVGDIWDAAGQTFDFVDLKNGTMLDVRLDMLVTTTVPNQEVEVALRLAISGFEYDIHFDSRQYKAAGEHHISAYEGIYIGDDNTRLNGGEFLITSDDNATVVMNGFYCKAILRG